MSKKIIISFILILLVFAGVFAGCKAKPVEQIDATGVSINPPQNASFAPGVKLILFTTMQPSNATNKTLIWTSADKDIATVNYRGEVFGIAKGKTLITVTTEQGQFKDSIEVTVLPGFCSMWRIKDKLTLPLSPKGKYDFTVYWGDGTKEHYTSDKAIHTYAKKGIYLVRITGVCEGFGFTGTIDPMLDPSEYPPPINDENKKNLLDITQWSNVKFHNYGGYFAGCIGLIKFGATDVPDLSNVTNMRITFASCHLFSSNLSKWDVSKVTNMSRMFDHAKEFNHDMPNWDTSNVERMDEMFDKAEKFNGDISNWDTSNVKTMQAMFKGAHVFNQDISKWDTSKVSKIGAMFSMAYAFNQDISNWDTSNVGWMSSVFFGATSFNQNISKWNTSKVRNMNSMFASAGAFNQDISEWDMSNVKSTNMMFQNARSFNQDISKWDMSEVGIMDGMFAGATSFNQDLSDWDTFRVDEMDQMFYGASAFTNGGNPGGLNKWKIQKGCSKKDIFKECPIDPYPKWLYAP